MRAETCVGPSTRLGSGDRRILTRMLQNDPEPSGIGLVILDEFHERSLQAIWRWRCCWTSSRGYGTISDRSSCRPRWITSGYSRRYRMRRSSPPKGAFRLNAAISRFPPISVSMKRWRSAWLICSGRNPVRCCCFGRALAKSSVQEQLAARVGSDVLLCLPYGALSLSDQQGHPSCADGAAVKWYWPPILPKPV